jgi:AAA15 family ATPase/GTPase
MIKSIHIQNFMAHSTVSMDQIPSINLIIGKNDTGKTGLLKLMYASLKSLEVYSHKKETQETSYKKELAEKLYDTFMPRKNGLGELVQKGSKEKLDVSISIANAADKYVQKLQYSFSERTEKVIVNGTEQPDPIPNQSINTLFVPAKEVLTAFNDIRHIRENFYGIGFDDTYLDLIKALGLQTSKGRVANELSFVNNQLENLFEGKIEQTGLQDQPFQFKKGNQRFSMQQTSEGIKKIGILTTLINNRQLGRGTVLFMDEPETALHPEAIRQMVEMLVAMSKAGVQIFMATHSYFIIKQLAICAKREQINACCWSLEKAADQSIQNSVYDLIDGVLPPNSIVEETLKMFDQEIQVDLTHR